MTQKNFTHHHFRPHHSLTVIQIDLPLDNLPLANFNFNLNPNLNLNPNFNFNLNLNLIDFNLAPPLRLHCRFVYTILKCHSGSD
jgi:hypothetical protein